MNQDNKKYVILVYDKECPACHAFCIRTRINESIGELVLIDARSESEDSRLILEEITELGWDIDQGMVLKVDDQLYYGSDAIHALALLSSRSGVFNRLNYWVFSSKPLSKVLYPILRSMRGVLLKFLGTSKINNLDIEGNDRF